MHGTENEKDHPFTTYDARLGVRWGRWCNTTRHPDLLLLTAAKSILYYTYRSAKFGTADNHNLYFQQFLQYSSHWTYFRIFICIAWHSFFSMVRCLVPWWCGKKSRQVLITVVRFLLHSFQSQIFLPVQRVHLWTSFFINGFSNSNHEAN